MKITFYQKSRSDNPSSRIKEWETELSDELYKKFFEVQLERKEEFEKAIDETYEEFPINDVTPLQKLNRKVLEELFPEWFAQQKEKIAADAIKDSGHEKDNARHDAGQVTIDGCEIYDSLFDLDPCFYNEDECQIIDCGQDAFFSYYLKYGDGSESSEHVWQSEMTYDELKTYLLYKKINGIEEYSFDDIRKALPEWTENLISRIYAHETAMYRKDIDPGADNYAEVMADKWNISQIAALQIRFDDFDTDTSGWD